MEQAVSYRTSRQHDSCSDSDSETEHMLPHRVESDQKDKQSDTGKMNVWSDFLNEEAVASHVNSVSVNSLPITSQNRQCEAYDFTQKQHELYDDEIVLQTTVTEENDLFDDVNSALPDIDDIKSVVSEKCLRTKSRTSMHNAKFHKKHHSKLQTSIKKRLGKRIPWDEVTDIKTDVSDTSLKQKQCNKEDLSFHEDIINSSSSSVNEFTYSLSVKLNEPKQNLLKRVVESVGIDKARNLLKMTENVESSGGVMTKDGKRRRTPGGIYLMLLKSDEDISKTKKNFIFAEENRILNQKKKQLIKLRQKGNQKSLKTTQQGENSKPVLKNDEMMVTDQNSTTNKEVCDDDMEDGEIIDD